MSEVQALATAAGELTQEQAERIALPRRYSIPMREMLQLQTRFDRTRGARALAFIASNRFRAAYDLYVLRARAGNADRGIADWWTRLQELAPEEQRRALGVGGRSDGATAASEPGERRPGRRRRGGRRRRRGAGDGSGTHPQG
jgi:poly(A) polymerase